MDFSAQGTSRSPERSLARPTDESATGPEIAAGERSRASIRGVLLIGLPIVVGLMALTALDAGGLAVAWENGHWTAAAVLALTVAVAGFRGARGLDGRLRALIVLSTAAWLAGQLAWNVQVALGPFALPAPSDVGFLGSLVPALLALVCVVRGRLSRADELAVYLDGGAIFLAISAVIVSIVDAPMTSRASFAAIAVAYPIAHLATAAAGLVALLATNAELRLRGGYLVLLGIAVTGFAWASYLAAPLAPTTAGQPANYVFSAGILMIGLGGATWTSEGRPDARNEAFARVALWLLPLAALGTSVVVLLLRRAAGEPLGIEDVAASGAILIAGMRQSVLVRELDWLLQSERTVRDDLVVALAQRAEAESLYRALVENGPAVVYLDLEDPSIVGGGRLAYLSPRIQGILGYEASAFVADPELFPNLIHPDDRDRALRAVNDHWATGEPLAAEYRVVARDGRVVWFRDEAYALRGADGRVVSQGVLLDTTAQKELEVRLRHDARHDPLTGLANRTLLKERLDTLARSPRQVRTALLFIDVDDFKVVNDTLGHEAGDRLLVQLAWRLVDLIRAADTAARVGGDEFTILLEDIGGPEDAIAAAARLIEAIRAPIGVAGRRLVSSASIGIAIADPGAVNAEDLLAEADAALYEAKLRGKDRWVLFDPEMRQRAWSRLEREADLRRAIEAREFEVHYQPIVDIRGGGIVELEALVRWRHPARGTLLPAEFIPAAEPSGLIVPIGRIVLEESCRQLAAWRDVVPPEVKLSVNLSARQAREADFVDGIMGVLGETGIDPRRLVLEITETAMLLDSPATQGAMRRLGELGIELVVDDFGTGFSALEYVKRLSVSGIKIDRSFVAGLGRDPADTAIVSATIAFAHALGLHVTAEGVETAEQLADLELLGCDRAQGFYFARPLPGPEVEPLIARMAAAPR